MSDQMQPDAASDTTIETHADETLDANTVTAETVPDAPETPTDGNADESADNADTFDREYVTKLRKESAGYRDKAKTAEAHADTANRRLHAALVTASGRLADPADLPYSAEHLESPDALNAAIDSLLEAKPHFKSRTPRGNVGQGVKDSATAQFDLGARLRSLV
jgi:hypothetical protein